MWIVKMKENLTAYDTFNEETFEGETCVETGNEWTFDTFEEAERFFLERKAFLKFFGGPGTYYTFPVKLD